MKEESSFCENVTKTEDREGDGEKDCFPASYFFIPALTGKFFPHAVAVFHIGVNEAI